MTHPDEEAVREALGKVSDLSNRAAAEEIGVSEATLRRWRDGEIATPLREPVRGAIYRFTGREDEARTEGPMIVAHRQRRKRHVGNISDRQLEKRKQEREADRERGHSDLTSLLASRKALYQTLTDFGGPGEATDDKLSLLELLSKVAARLKREGRDVDARHVLAAQNDVINGDL